METYENTELMNTEVEKVDVYDSITTSPMVEGESGSGKGTAALVLGGIAVIGAGVAFVANKIRKSKEGDKPKKKKKLIWVEVEDEKYVDDECEEFADDVEEVSEEFEE